MVINTTKPESLRAKYDLDIEQLDYKFIQHCTKVKTIESILKVLRSGQEGVYPDLVRFTEERLRILKPSSALLRTEQPAKTLHSLDHKERDELLSDLKEWRHEVSAADAELKTPGSNVSSQLPPVRGTVQVHIAAPSTGEEKPQSQPKPTRIASYDYAAWDRYDVEAQLRLLDEREAPTAAAPQSAAQRPSDPAIDDQPPVEGLSDAERSALALREKQKGNEYFRSGDFSRAAVYYTRSINASPTVAALNNRAQANLKLGKYGSALLDCGAVLRREPNNVKALLRRGIARQMNHDWIKARLDFQQVLQLEHNNPQARHHLSEVEKAIIGSETKRSKVLIQEVDSMEEENIRETKTSVGDGDKQSKSQRAKKGVKDPESIYSEGDKNTIAKETALIQTSASTNTEEVVINARLKNKRPESAQKDISTRKQAEVSGKEHQTTSMSTHHLPDLKVVTGENKDTTSIISQAQKQATVTDAPQQSPQTPVEDCCTSGHHLTGQPAPPAIPADTAGAGAPRRFSTFEFMRRWRCARRSDGSATAMAALLRSVEPHQLTEVLGSELDSALLSNVIR